MWIWDGGNLAHPFNQSIALFKQMKREHILQVKDSKQQTGEKKAKNKNREPTGYMTQFSFSWRREMAFSFLDAAPSLWKVTRQLSVRENKTLRERNVKGLTQNKWSKGISLSFLCLALWLHAVVFLAVFVWICPNLICFLETLMLLVIAEMFL